MIRFISGFFCVLSTGILLTCAQPAFSVQAGTQPQKFSLSTSSLTMEVDTTHSIPGVSLLPVLACYSSNPHIASVSPEGILTAHTAGTTTILYNKQGQFYTLNLTVKEPSSSPANSSSEFTAEETLLFMEKGDSYPIKLTDSSGNAIAADSSFSWSSSDNEVAQVDPLGNVKAKKKGSAIITCTNNTQSLSIYINVITRDYSGKRCEFSILTANGKTRTYQLYKQNSYNYPKYNHYIGWHGCATCSLATVLGAYSSSYANILPSEVIDGPEKATVSSNAWDREHVERTLPKQMPLSLYGISSILEHCNVANDYVRTYEEDTAKEDITQHLKTGNPIIFEVRQKSNKTGKKNDRWTNSYHTMVLLGILTNGNVLVCDSIDRNWENNGNRIIITSLDDVMEFMFPCTEFSKSMYYDGANSDGGYIKIFES